MNRRPGAAGTRPRGSWLRWGWPRWRWCCGRFATDPKVAGPVSIAGGVCVVFAIGVLLRERIRRDGTRGWWAVLGTVGLPAAVMGHVLFWGTHAVLEHRYPFAMGLAVGGTLLMAIGFRRAHNPRLSRVLGGLGAISLAAKLIAMPPMLPIEGVGSQDVSRRRPLGPTRGC